MRTNATALAPTVRRPGRSDRARAERPHVVVAAVIATTALCAQEPPHLSPAAESYAAHIAAAEAALARNATGAVRRWLDAAADQSVAAFEAHAAGVSALALSPDGSRVATCGEDDRLSSFDIASRTEVWSRDLKDGYCLAWSGDGERLWFLPLAKEVVCFDARPLRDRPR